VAIVSQSLFGESSLAVDFSVEKDAFFSGDLDFRRRRDFREFVVDVVEVL